VRDDPGAAWACLARTQFRYPNVPDPSAAMLAGLHVRGVPVMFVLDSTGVVVFRHIGELHGSDIADMESAARSAGCQLRGHAEQWNAGSQYFSMKDRRREYSSSSISPAA